MPHESHTVSRRDYLLERFMDESITTREQLELKSMLAATVADTKAPMNDRVLSSLVSRLIDARAGRYGRGEDV